ncbi:vWA domain-containing protein [Nannocystaceae bacterium ST9]
MFIDARSRSVAFLFAGSLGLVACGGDEKTEGGPLAGGDAEWPQAPIPQPGGEGQTDDGGVGDDAGDDGGVGETGDTGDGDGDTGEAYPCEPAPEGLTCEAAPGVCEAVPWTDWGDTGTDTGTSDTGTGTSDTGTSDTGTSDTGTSDTGTTTDGGTDTGTTDGGDPPMSPMACCEDLDCNCFAGLCTSTACQADGFCDCNCPIGSDPDCAIDSCALPAPAAEEGGCPSTTDPIVLYMSNDDSNSQASPAFVRRIVSENYVVPASRVRIHEFLNYYDLSYANPTDTPAEVGIQMRRTDAEAGEFTLLLYAQGQELRAEQRPPYNLVFSLDRSGSMTGEPIELLKDVVLATASQLRAGDVISLVQWNTDQTVMLDGYAVTGPDDPTLVGMIESIQADGSTDLNAGLVAAYDLANEHYITDGINRVFMISDGGANAGVTDVDLIASQASDSNGKGIYLIGVGVSEASGYYDDLMDTVTDAGKGAYLFVDTPGEAERMFGDPMRFLANTTVAARDVRMQLTMPWYFGIKEFHGEEYSANPEEVEPQHLANNDAMSFHQIIQSCDPSAPQTDDVIKARVDYLDPITGEARSDELEVSLGDLVAADATQLHKGDVVVGYAKTFIVIDSLIEQGQTADAIGTAQAMVDWLDQAAQTLADDEVAEMRDVMADYVGVLTILYG